MKRLKTASPTRHSRYSTSQYGDKPAPAISTEAVYKTAELFHEDNLLKNSSNVDDLIDSQMSVNPKL